MKKKSVKKMKKKNMAMGAIYLRSYLTQQHTSVIPLKWTLLIDKIFKAKSRSKGKNQI